MRQAASFRLTMSAMKKPKPIFLPGAAALAVLCALSFPAPACGEVPADEQAVVQIVNEIAAQHAKIAANQQAIEQKLAAIEENLRVARIYVSRGGGKK